MLPRPSDDVPAWMDAQQGGQVTGWVGAWCFGGHSLPGGGTRSQSSIPEEEMEGSGTGLGDDSGSMEKPWGPMGSEPGAHLAAGRDTAPWAV